MMRQLSDAERAELQNKIAEHKLETTEQVKLNISQQGGEKGGFFAPEKAGIKKGVLGGIVMMAIAVIWFVAGYAAGYIFFYPPILFLIGIYAFIKGIVIGNLSGGEKNLPRPEIENNPEMKN